MSQQHGDEKYHYEIRVHRLQNGRYGVGLTQHLTGFGAPVNNREEAVETLQDRLNYLSTQAPHNPSPHGDDPTDPIPVSIQTVHVTDETDLGIVAADLVEDQSQLVDYAGNQPIRTDGGAEPSDDDRDSGEVEIFNLKNTENGREAVFFGETENEAIDSASEFWGVESSNIEEMEI